MRVIIMAGGKGTRLMPLTANLPKPLMPVLNRPIISYSIELALKHKINDIGVTVCHMADMIIDRVSMAKNFAKARFHFFHEEMPLGTAGSVKNADFWLEEDDCFAVISGDALTNIDLTDMLVYHKITKADLTMAVKYVDNPSEFGVVASDYSGRVTGFLEKPKHLQGVRSQINCGIYIVNTSLLNLIPENTIYDFSKNLFPYMLDKKYHIQVYSSDFYWRDIGSIDDYFLANMDMLNQRHGLSFFDIDVNNMFMAEGKVISVGKNAYIDSRIEIGNNVIVGNNAFLEGNISLSNCIITDNAYINTSCHDCIATGEHYLPITVEQENIISAIRQAHMYQSHGF